MRYYREDMADEKARALLEAAYDATCPDCNRRFAEPKMSNLVLKLHAYRYAGADWGYTAPLPGWVKDCEKEDIEALIKERLPLL